MKSINYNIIFNIIFSISILLSGFNFIPNLRFYNIPFYHFSIFIFILSILFFSKINLKLKVYNFEVYYKLFIIFSIPSLIISVILNKENAILVFFYNITPIIIYNFYKNNLSIEQYYKFAFLLLISVFIIVIIGWLIRLNLIPINVFYDVKIKEYLLGYWGIKYQTSTRNHDTIYPIVGLAYSFLFYKQAKNKIYLFLCLFFMITLIASLSRGALIITIIFTFILTYKELKLRNFLFFLFLLFSFYIFYNLSNYIYWDVIFDNFLSIFETKNENSRFSNEDRLLIAKKAIESSLFNPIGYGIENYSSIYETNINKSYTAENVFLTILVERGWLAFIFYFRYIYSILNLNKLNHYNLINYFLCIFLLFNYEINNLFINMLFFFAMINLNIFNNENISFNSSKLF